MLNIEDNYYEVLENIDGLVVIDSDGKIVFISQKSIEFLENLYKKKIGNVIGKSIREVTPENKTYETLITGKTEVGDYYDFDGLFVISNRKPIYKEGKIIGAMEYDFFDDKKLFSDFVEKINLLSSELNYYKQEVRELRGAKYSINGIIGESLGIEKLREEILVAANSNSTVLIQGETGTGKELVAHSIHSSSQRNSADFVKVNCAAIPQELMESELFGYEEGAFTGAKKNGKKGKFEIAHGGTIFLDEINQMPLSMQPKLLRFLQEREISKVGGEHSIGVDVRVIVASNENLYDLVRKGKFREDLFYRLNVLSIKIPALRERKEDIPKIVMGLIARINIYLGTDIESASKDVVTMLQNYEWPGNVRELQNIIERAMNICKEKQLEIENFREFISGNSHEDEESLELNNETESWADAKTRLEKRIIINALRKSSGNKTEAAKELQITRSFLYKKIKKLGIDIV